MSNFPSTSKQDENNFEDNEIFEDSSIFANFEHSFKNTSGRTSVNNANECLNKSDLNVSALCCDEELNGYDKLTGQTWIYPTNYPVRDYQFNIINSTILKNTLVSLPTGLGKTFIAAVIMYNFYRWYPRGKIVFTAPTRPLVAQQIEACYNIVAIPPQDTVEMTGHMQQSTRKTHWETKRVFFATPQVIYNDIKSGICPGDRIRCLVIDEAHRARGNYAYCQIVSTLTDMGHKLYRVLALSATPGSKVEDVINVVKNLHIAHLELRTESCIDVAPYSHSRRIATVVVPLGTELTQLRNHYVEILDGYARNLKDMSILPQNLGNLSKGRIVMLYKEFQNRDRSNRHPRHNVIMKDFTLLIALFHGLELLTRHGERVFLNFFDEHPEKTWIQADDRLTMLLERLRDDLGINPLSLNRSILPDGTVPEIPKNISFGHPKFYKLKEIMLEHFKRAKAKEQDTRAIVFCEYRESVNLVHCLLLQCRPLIVPQMFVGQGASGKDGKTMISQKQQLRVMRNFREGACNALVATCVAEEGLDVGSVDLIVCFDISTRSPIRLVQRCGRTGRERGGQVFILVTEGREHQTLQDCMRQRDGLNARIQQSREVRASLYELNPRMLPLDFRPTCQKMFITVAKKDDKSDGAKKGQKDLRSMLLGRTSTARSSFNKKEAENTELITEQEFNEIFPEGFNDFNLFEEPKELWAMNKDKIKVISNTEAANKLDLSTWLQWQRTSQTTVNIHHSTDTDILTSLLEYGDAKRFNEPTSTQNPSFNTQELATQNIVAMAPPKSIPKRSSPIKTKETKKKQKIVPKSTGKNDGDIRALFSTATKSTKNYSKLISDLGIKNDGSIPTRLINLMVDLSLESNNAVKTCYVCQNVCNCAFLTKIKKNKKTSKTAKILFLREGTFPDINLIDEFTEESIMSTVKTLDENLNLEVDKDVSYLKVDDKNICKNFDLEFDFDSPIDISSPDRKETTKPDENAEKNFDLGDIDDIFAESSPEEGKAAEVAELENKNSSNPKEALGFFGLDSIDDIFADSDDSADVKIIESPPKSPKRTQRLEMANEIPEINEYPRSPSILSGKVNTNVPTSPILCSQVRKFNLSTKKRQPQSSTPNNIRRQLLPDTSKIVNTMAAGENSRKSYMQISEGDTTNKSMFTITQLVDMINKTGNDKSNIAENHKTNEKNEKESNEYRSPSPILLTQADRKKSLNSVKLLNDTKIPNSLIILDSDSDSDDNTQVYDVEEKVVENSRLSKPLGTPEKLIHFVDTQDDNKFNCNDSVSSFSNKRKIDSDSNDVLTNSPYFNKKHKLNSNVSKPLTLQEKVLAALSSNKVNDNTFNNDNSVNFMFSPVKCVSQKENKNPNGIYDKSDKDKEEYVRKSNLAMLQVFRRDSQVDSPKQKFESHIKSQKASESSQKRKIMFDDSDDDFVDSESDRKALTNGHRIQATNHKVRKKKKTNNSFLDLEAELSDDGDQSGDELSDSSVGSIIDFICDDNVTHHEDMQAHYMRSVKSPVNGVFKIPQLPKKFENVEVFSQHVDEDAYEMDSFCVDSHIGLTQMNDVSDLEVAEMLLEGRKKKKRQRIRSESPESDNANEETGMRKSENQQNSTQNNESPLVRRKKRNVKNRIQSDSDED